jgi:phosphoribosyl-AMP cyclohydrolase / phosphoribosyl-ATP pyrophosphohydrolase
VTPDDVVFDARGLVPAVVQEAESGEVLMVAWMNREALDRTLATGLTHFWSRSRQTLWRKGDTSGHAQHVRSVSVDCDTDTLLVQVHQDGVACHTGHRTCFFRELTEHEDPAGRPEEAAEPTSSAAARQGAGPAASARATAGMLGRLERIIEARKVAPPPGSYVGALLQKGEAAICRKVGEEAVEVVTAALGGEGDRRVVEEVADLWFHTLVLLGARSIVVADVLEELARRHGQRAVSG